MSEATTKPGSCQVRIYTESSCPRRAEVEMLGLAFCGACARQQEAYFAIGELTQEETYDPCGRALGEALKRMRRGGACARPSLWRLRAPNLKTLAAAPLLDAGAKNQRRSAYACDAV